MRKIEVLKRICFSTVICALVLQMIPATVTGNDITQTTQEDFEGGETWNTNITLSPGNVTLEPSSTDWIKGKGNPVLNLGPSGSWDDFRILDCFVRNEDGIYRMWYTGDEGGATFRIGYAESYDGFNWDKYSNNPIMDMRPGTYDEDGVFGPFILYENGEYKMWYTGGSPGMINSEIGYANSTDGLNWTRPFTVPVVNETGGGGWDDGEVVGPCVINDSGLYKMWYGGWNGGVWRIGYATSNNGINWTKLDLGFVPGTNIINLPLGSDDNQNSPFVLKEGNTYHMWYNARVGMVWQICYANSTDGLNWTKASISPVIPVGPSGSWDDVNVRKSNVINESGMFRMWFSGWDGSSAKIGHAISYDAVNWTKRAVNPVLDLGLSGTWEDWDVISPSIIFDGNNYKMWYEGGDNSVSQIGLATSQDGLMWNRNSNTPVLYNGTAGEWDESGVRGPNVIYNNGLYHMWYFSNGDIGYANSSDGINWMKYSGNPILENGSTGMWDSVIVEYPEVIFSESIYKMWYSGTDGSKYRIGYATSSDGINWIKYDNNPVLNIGIDGEWDDNYATSPCVIFENNIYNMWYSGNDGSIYRIGYATSSDGINWTKSELNPIVASGISGEWDDNNVAMPEVILDDYSYKMWYIGDGDGHGRIGYATGAYGKRFIKEHSNPVLDIGPVGSWDDNGIGAPSILYENGTYKMWYVGTEGGPYTDKIGYATSTDGFIWNKYYQNPILNPSPPVSWDDYILGFPCVIYNGNEYLMYYHALTNSDPYGRIGVANSSDGINWIKSPLNPVIDLGLSGTWDDYTVHSCSVIYRNGSYQMWYTGSPIGGIDDAEIGYATSLDGYNWTKYPSNPIFHRGGAGTWDSSSVSLPSVWYEDNIYHLWYMGKDSGGNVAFGYASSNDGINWTKYPNNPILSSGSGGSWDDALIQGPNVIKVNNTFRMWYWGSDGSRDRIGHAISYDGINWTKRALNPVIDLPTGVRGASLLNIDSEWKMWYYQITGSIGYANSSDGIYWNQYQANPIMNEAYPSVVYNGSGYRMYYHDFNLATSSDGITWTPYSGNPLLTSGPPGSWDSGEVGYSCVIIDEGIYKMWYIGQGPDGIFRLGYATSPDGLIWSKYSGNPVMEGGPIGTWDEASLSSNMFQAFVVRDGPVLKMIYTGPASGSLGIATSIDGGITWTKSALNPVLKPGSSGCWDSYRLLDAHLALDNDTYKLWYSGDMGTNDHDIGYAESFNLGQGTYESSIIDSNNPGAFWNSISWNETLPPNTIISLSVRTGDSLIPNSSWSNWSEEIYDSSGSIISPLRGRYIQYRATLVSLNAKYTPILEDVTINFGLNTASPPTLSSPIKDIRISDNTPDFTWTYNDPNSDTQGGFNVEISDDPSFTLINYDSGEVTSDLSTWSPTTPILDGTWYWRVKTKDEYGLWSAWSENWTLNIDTTPPSFVSGTEDFITYTGDNFIIYANFTDNFNVTSVTIHYKNEFGIWVSKFMIKDTEGGPGEVDDFSITSSVLGVFTLYDDSEWYFYFEASDGLQNSTHGNSTSPFTITVIDNIPPVPNAGSDLTIDEDTLFWLDAALSSDNIGITDYYWDFDANNGIGIDASTIAAPWFYLDPGSYIVTLQVWDEAGNWNSTTITITVRDTTPPNAYAGMDKTVELGNMAYFDGSGSLDNNGTAGLIYTWDFDDSDGIGADSFGMTTSFEYGTLGSYVVTLNVTDSEGHWDTDTLVITIVDTSRPFANAGPDQIVDEDTPVIVDGNGSIDNSGFSNLNYVWDWDASNGISGDNNTMSAIHVYPNPGFYIVTLNVTDASGNWDIDILTIFVRDITPPVADAGSDKVVSEDVFVYFDASGSSDNAGFGGLKFSWDFDDSDGIDVDAVGAYVIYVYNDPGVYTVTLNVSDASGNWDTTTISVLVKDLTAPIALAEDDVTIDQGEVAYFDGSNSTDNNGTAGLIYTWDFNSEDGISVDATGITSQQIYNEIGVYIVTLNVTDSEGNWAIDTVIVTVRDITPPVADAGPGQIAGEDAFVYFDASGSSDNAGFEGLTFTWDFDDSDGIDVDAIGPYVSHVYYDPGVYTVTLNVTDERGNWDTTTISVLVQDLTAPFASAGDDITIDQGDQAYFDGSGSTDNNGTAGLIYTWDFNSQDGISIDATGITTQHIYDEMGVYIVTLIVTDSEGNWAIDTVEVTVRDTTNPIADAGSDEIIDEDSIITFDGTDSSDNDPMEIASYEWTFFDGVDITLTGSQPNYRFDTPGNYDVTLTVKDSAGNIDTDSVTITVNDITSPRADAGLELTIVEGTVITFDGTDSIDNGGVEGLTYVWTVQFDDTTDTLDGVNPNYTFEHPGPYFVILNVTDSSGNWDIDTIVITVLPDFDGDKVSDEDDPDDDNDGTLDTEDAFPFDPNENKDTDGDGVGNNADTDDDGDSVIDSEDAFPLDATEWLDTDKDGVGNNKDRDDDNDGRIDEEDYRPLDPDIQDPPFPWWLLIIGVIIGFLLGILLARKRKEEEEEQEPPEEDEKITPEKELENKEIYDELTLPAPPIDEEQEKPPMKEERKSSEIEGPTNTEILEDLEKMKGQISEKAYNELKKKYKGQS